MGVLTRQVDVCFMDKNKRVQHTRVSLKVGSVLTYENIRAALAHEIKQRDERMIADTKRLYDAVKAKYEETKATGAPLFEELSYDKQKALGYSIDAFEYERLEVSDILGWSLIQTI